jgi:hypothetical protein
MSARRIWAVDRRGPRSGLFGSCFRAQARRYRIPADAGTPTGAPCRTPFVSLWQDQKQIDNVESGNVAAALNWHSEVLELLTTEEKNGTGEIFLLGHHRWACAEHVRRSGRRGVTSSAAASSLGPGPVPNDPIDTPPAPNRDGPRPLWPPEAERSRGIKTSSGRTPRPGRSRRSYRTG